MPRYYLGKSRIRNALVTCYMYYCALTHGKSILLCGTYALVHKLAQKGVFGRCHVSKGDMHKRPQIKTPLLG